MDNFSEESWIRVLSEDFPGPQCCLPHMHPIFHRWKCNSVCSTYIYMLLKNVIVYLWQFDTFFFFIEGWVFGMTAVEMKMQTYINYHPLWCGNSSNVQTENWLCRDSIPGLSSGNHTQHCPNAPAIPSPQAYVNRQKWMMIKQMDLRRENRVLSQPNNPW